MAVSDAASGASLRVDVTGHRVSVVGLPAGPQEALAALDATGWRRALTVHAGEAGSGRPAIAGTHSLDSEGLHFRPLFPFVSGVKYVASFAWRDQRLERRFEVTAPVGEPPVVRAIHPASAILPENTLRLYVHFSRPMRARNVHEHVRLVDGATGPVPLAFVEVADGLWNPDQTRLTLFFHPGRVKRGVAPGERLGPPLRAGRAYRLIIDGGLTDTAGVPLGAPYEHRFRAGEADRTPPQVGEVRLAAPGAQRGTLTVTFGEPVDHALVQRWVWVEDGEGRPVTGEGTVGQDGTTWMFAPVDDWRPGRYVVRVRGALEDRAGNRFDRPFDRESGSRATDEGAILSLPFELRR